MQVTRSVWLTALTTASVLLLPFSGGPVAGAFVRADRLSTRVLPAPQFLKVAKPGRVVAANAPVTATIVLAGRNPAGLARYAALASTPGSPLFRHWLTPQEVLQRFGPTAATRHLVAARLRADGLTTVTHAWTITASGTARAWSHLLHTELRWFNLHGVWFRGQATAAYLPPWLAVRASGITGLTDYAPPAPLITIPRPRPMHVVKLATLRPAAVARPTAVVHAATFSQNFSVTATIAGPTSRTTGLPIHVVFQATYNGQPDTAAGLGPNSFAGATNTGQSPYGWGLSGIDGGYTIVGIVSPYALTADIQVTIYAQVDSQGNPVAGTPSVTITLPPLTWAGPETTLDALNAEEINALYDGASLQAEGPKATVGIIAVAPPSPGILKALNNFTSANQLTPPTITTVQVTEGQVPSGWAAETDMDLQAAEATAPGAHMIVYADPTLDLGAFFQAVVNQPVPVVSLSLGGSGIDSSIASLVAAASAEGVTIVVSSGDFGSESGAFPSGNTPTVLPPAVSEPADLPQVTAVGGTDVAVDAATNQAAATTAWGGNYLSVLPPLAQEEVLWSYAATGGGYSETQTIPSWQASYLPAGSSGRGVPDIALMADPYVAGILMWAETGGQEVGGGTSLGAPLLAGWTADMAVLVKKPLGNLNPMLYQLATETPAVFTQAASGDNGAFQISTSDNEPGTWNPLTGLGSPDISQLADAETAAGQASVGVSFSQTALTIPSAVVITASSVNLASPSYRLRVQTPWNLVWHTTDWQSSPWWQYQAPVPGLYAIQVLARDGQGGPVVASPIEMVRFSTDAPMVSNLVVFRYPGSATVPAGTSVRIRALATDPHGKALYQFKLEEPGGRFKTGLWSFGNVITYKHLKPGRYVVFVAARDVSQTGATAWEAYQRTLTFTVTTASAGAIRPGGSRR